MNKENSKPKNDSSFCDSLEEIFCSHVSDLKIIGSCYFLPFSLKSVHLEDIGVFENLQLSFKKTNIVFGEYGSGKTTLVKSIAFAYNLIDEPSFHLLKENKKDGRITVYPEKVQTANVGIKSNSESDYVVSKKKLGCLLLDEPFQCLTQDKITHFLKYLKKQDVQIILTTSPINSKKQFKKVFENLNFLKLNDKNTQRSLML